MKYYGIREFARKAGISPQRLSGLIKQGKVRVNEAGQVGETELLYFLRERLKKSVDNCQNTHLVLTVGMPPDKASAVLDQQAGLLRKADDRTTEADSVDAFLIGVVSKADSSPLDNEALAPIISCYQKTLLKELVTRTQDAAVRCIGRYMDTELVRGIPVGSLYELLLYGRLYGESAEKEEEYLSALESRASSEGSTTLCLKDDRTVPMQAMEASYCSICMSLGFADRRGNLLIKRSELSPEIVTAIIQMDAADGKSPDNEAVQRFLSIQIELPNQTGVRTRSDGLEARKIMDSVMNKYMVRERGLALAHASTGGFYTCKVSESVTKSRESALVSDILGGFYTDIKVICEDEDSIGNMPVALMSAVNTAARERYAAVEVVTADKLDSSSDSR